MELLNLAERAPPKFAVFCVKLLAVIVTLDIAVIDITPPESPPLLELKPH